VVSSLFCKSDPLELGGIHQTGAAGVKDTLMSDDLKITGSKIDRVRFFMLIDKTPGTFAIVIS
jgi:hypothetical protein